MHGKIRPIFAHIAVLVLCVVVLYLCTPYGLGVSPDSVMYLAAARSLKAGLGLQTLQWNGTYSFMGHFPPVFSVVLAAIPEVLQYNAFYVQAALLFLSSFVVFLIARLLFNKAWLPYLMQLLFIISYSVLYVHTQVWSEPFMILGVLTAAYFGIIYGRTKETKVLVLLLIVTMLLPLIRYASLFLIPIIWSYIICVQNNWSFTTFVNGFKNRDAKLVITTLIVSVIQFIVLIFPYELWGKYVNTQQSSVRSIAWHPITTSKVSQGVNIVVTWFTPYYLGKALTFGLFAIIAICLLIWLVLTVKKTIANKWKESEMLFLIAIVAGYIGFLILSISLFDAATPLDTRLLSPIYPLIMLIFAAGVFQPTSVKAMNVVMRVLALFFALTTIYSGLRFVKQSHEFGQEYADRLWQQSETVNAAKDLDPSYFLVSNSREGIYSLTGKAAATLPKKFNNKGAISVTLMNELKNYAQVKSCVVYFNRKFWNSSQLPTQNDIAQTGLWPVMNSYEDGTIFCSK